MHEINKEEPKIKTHKTIYGAKNTYTYIYVYYIEILIGAYIDYSL